MRIRRVMALLAGAAIIVGLPTLWLLTWIVDTIV